MGRNNNQSKRIARQREERRQQQQQQLQQQMQQLQQQMQQLQLQQEQHLEEEEEEQQRQQQTNADTLQNALKGLVRLVRTFGAEQVLQAVRTIDVACKTDSEITLSVKNKQLRVSIESLNAQAVASNDHDSAASRRSMNADNAMIVGRTDASDRTRSGRGASTSAPGDFREEEEDDDDDDNAAEEERNNRKKKKGKDVLKSDKKGGS